MASVKPAPSPGAARAAKARRVRECLARAGRRPTAACGNAARALWRVSSPQKLRPAGVDQNQASVGVAHVPFRALRRIGERRLFQMRILGQQSRRRRKSSAQPPSGTSRRREVRARAPHRARRGRRRIVRRKGVSWAELYVSALHEADKARIVTPIGVSSGQSRWSSPLRAAGEVFCASIVGSSWPRHCLFYTRQQRPWAQWVTVAPPECWFSAMLPGQAGIQTPSGEAQGRHEGMARARCQAVLPHRRHRL